MKNLTHSLSHFGVEYVVLVLSNPCFNGEPMRLLLHRWKHSWLKQHPRLSI